MPEKQFITPLSVFASSLVFTEAVLTVAAVVLRGWLQATMVIFVIIFACCIGAAFFTILWKKVYVLYTPSEYGNIDPVAFVKVIRDVSPEVASLASSVEKHPLDMEAQHALIFAFMPDQMAQITILMHEIKRPHPRATVYKGRSPGSIIQGNIVGSSWENLENVGLVTTLGEFCVLTPMGEAFALWQIRNGHREESFRTTEGGWGSIPEADLLPLIKDHNEKNKDELIISRAVEQLEG